VSSRSLGKISASRAVLVPASSRIAPSAGSSWSAVLIGGASVASKVNGGTFQGHTYAQITDPTKILSQVGFAGVLYFIGSTAFKMLVPILSGFIAFAMADRPGLVPGIVAGLLATAVGAGFLGGLLGGLIAGAVTLAILKVQVPRALAGVMPVVIIPLVTTLIVGVIMVVAIGQPIASAQHAMTNWLNGLSGTSGLLLGAVVLSADGDGADKVLDELVALLATDLDAVAA
jgi:fructose PTS system EIIBC or EIIC component